MAYPSEHLQSRSLDPLAQNRMQAAPRHDVGFVSKDSGSGFLHIHQLEQPERSLGMIEKQINIGILTCLAPCGRAEQVEMLDAEPLQLGFVLLKLGNGFAAFHRLSRRQWQAYSTNRVSLLECSGAPDIPETLS